MPFRHDTAPIAAFGHGAARRGRPAVPAPDYHRPVNRPGTGGSTAPRGGTTHTGGTRTTASRCGGLRGGGPQGNRVPAGDAR
ncbi:hypothetical protein SVIOM342S_03515 [Streptomyces violaceorubidus]